jgi:hypothetical protein
MGTREAFRQRVRREQLRKARLRVATVRLTDAEQERIWAIVAAHEAGLSLRQIAAATGLSHSRIHQLLQDNAARAIPTWLSHLRGRVHDSDSIREALPPGSQAQIQDRVAEEVEVLRWCLDWLERRARGEQVIVDLRPVTRRMPLRTSSLTTREGAESWHGWSQTSTR